ncbi:MAG TPA: dienelactone hydrolase family protein [Bryobacteraceae bacterium]|jgi:dienelactone hydrolase|nr:dienelactone hydrolase family protein [Bryobacteraceae bacterium]
MRTQTFEYKLEDKTFKGYLALDETQTGKRPGVLVVHEAWGLGEHSKNRANRLAEMGYVALAVDMFGDGYIPKTTQEGMEIITALRNEPTTLRARIRAAFDALVKLPEVDPKRTASIGFCFGGGTSIELARSGAPVSAIVSFHGGLQTKMPAEPGVVKAKVLSCTGHDDPFIPPSLVLEFMDEMTKAGVDFQAIVYGNTKHSFTEPRASERGVDALAYSKSSDERSWRAMQDLFEEAF